MHRCLIRVWIASARISSVVCADCVAACRCLSSVAYELLHGSTLEFVNLENTFATRVTPTAAFPDHGKSSSSKPHTRLCTFDLFSRWINLIDTRGRNTSTRWFFFSFFSSSHVELNISGYTDRIYEYNHIAELVARACLSHTKKRIYSPFIGQMLSRGVQISGRRLVRGAALRG